MSRILVSHVTPFPDKLTGIGVYTWKIVEALVRHGRHDYVLATNWTAAKLPSAIAGLGIEIVHRRLPRNEAATLAVNTVALPRLARRTGSELVFHPQPTSMLTGLGRSVVVIHDLYRVTNAPLYPLAQRLQWRLGTSAGFRRAGGLIAVSNATRDALVAAYPEVAGKTTTVHEASPIAPPAEPATPATPPYALMVANVTPNKNVALLYAAAEALAREGFDADIRLAGRDDAGLLPELARRHPDARITRLGPLSDTALAAQYAGASVYVNSSLVEGFCLPVLEAQGMGVPVICSDIPVLREVAGDGARFVDPADAAALARALRDCLTTPSPAMRLRARENAARFGWDKAARETEAVFDRVLAAAGRR